MPLNPRLNLVKGVRDIAAGRRSGGGTAMGGTVLTTTKQHAIDGPEHTPPTLGGDLAGSGSSLAVASIQGVDVSAAGTPDIGDVITAVAADAAEWRPGGTTVNFIIDGGGSAIVTGIKGDVMLHRAGTITEWEVLADQIGDIVVDLWAADYAGFPPVVGGSITGAEKPTLSGAICGQDVSLNGGAGWAVAAGTILRFNVDSAATLTRATVALRFRA